MTIDMRLCQVVELAEGAACFHNDKVDFVFFEDGLVVVSIGRRVKEFMLSSF